MSTPIEASELAADKPDVHTDGDEEREEREEGGVTILPWIAEQRCSEHNGCRTV